VPRLTQIRTGVLEELANQLRYAPTRTVLRQIESIESLASEIEPDALYPEDFIVYRVTGYRSPMGEPAMLVGSALLADLSALAERISGGGRLTLEAHATAGELTIDDLCARWGVSKKTIERYRRRGLIARRLRREDGKEVVRFSARAVEWFVESHHDLLKDANSFERVGESREHEIVERARTMKDEDRKSVV